MQTLATEATQGLIGSWVWLCLLHSLWIGLISFSMIALAFQLGWPKSHRTRHAVLAGGLCTVVLGPPAAVQAQAFVFHWPGVDDEAHVRTTSRVLMEKPATEHPQQASASSKPTQSGRPDFWQGVWNVGLQRATEIVQSAQPYGLAIWTACVSFMTSTLAFGAIGVFRLGRFAKPAPSHVGRRLRGLGRGLRLKRIPAVRIHPSLDEPCLCGLFRPFVLLPARWLATAPVESLEAVLAHELAHARRFDHVTTFVQRIIETLFFFHPGVHWLSRSLRRESEHCADALAVRLTGDPLALARALESVASLRSRAARPSLLGASLGGDRSTLLPRIQELLGMKPTRPRLTAWPLVALPSALAIALVSISVGFAQDAPAVQSSSPSNSDSPAPVPTVAKDDQVDLPTVGVQVRFIDVDLASWDRLSKNRLKPSGSSQSGQEHLVDGPDLNALLNDLSLLPTCRVVAAPKVTTFEEASAVIVNSSEAGESAFRDMQIWSRDTKSIIRADNASVRLTESQVPKDPNAIPADALKVSIGVKVKGTRVANGHRVRVDVLTLIPGQPLKGSEAFEGPLEVSRFSECDVPDDSSLVISSGLIVGQSDPSTRMHKIVVVTPQHIPGEKVSAPEVR